MKNDNYIVIQGWMVNELKLSGLKLITYALIFGFCQDEESRFKGSLSYIMKCLQCSRPTAIKTLRELEGMGLVKKFTIEKQGVTFNEFQTLGVVKKLNYPSKETLPNNTNDNTTTINKGLFPEFEIDKKKKSLYRNSDLSKEDIFKKVFEQEISAGVDMMYYGVKVMRWSNTKEGVKRGFYGWRDTVLNFADGDKEKGKLKMITKLEADSEFSALFND